MGRRVQPLRTRNSSPKAQKEDGTLRKRKMMGSGMNRKRCFPVLLLGVILLLTSLLVGCAQPTPPASPTIAFSPSSLSFSAEEGGANPASKTLSISNSGGGTLDWTVTTDANWVSLSPTSGASTGESDSVTVSANIYGMDGGDYAASITISGSAASNSPQTVAVVLNIAAPPPKETDTYINSEYGFSIDYYKDWDVIEDYMVLTVMFAGPALPDLYIVNVNIEITQLGPSVTLDDYVGMFILSVKRRIQDFAKVEEYDTTIGGVPATVLLITGTLEVAGREFRLRDKVALLVEDGVGYIITYDVTSQFHDEHLDAFELAINSFTFVSK